MHGLYCLCLSLSLETLWPVSLQEIYTINVLFSSQTLNEDADEGRTSGVVAWPGYNFHYGPNHRLPTHSMSFASNLTYKQWVEGMDTAISWLEHHTAPANLVVFYLAEPDTTGHLYGPESEQVYIFFSDYILESFQRCISLSYENLPLSQEVD